MQPTIQINMGAVMFIIVLFYIAANLFIYLNKPRISVYEVQQKKLSDAYTCTGMVLRDEKIVKANKTGYYNFYYADGSHVGKNQIICTIDETGEIYNLLSSQNNNVTLSKNDRKVLWNHIHDFRQSYNPSQYATVSDFVYDVGNAVLELTSSNVSKNVKELIKENNLSESSYSSITSNQVGLISYAIDGYESKKAEDISVSDFQGGNYKKEQLHTNEKIQQGKPAYKMITSENWTLVLEISKDIYDTLEKRQEENKAANQDTSYVKIAFNQEDISMTRAYTLRCDKKAYFAIIPMQDYIVHFTDNRFVSVDISLDNVEGLKIPTSSITKKSFYTVPEEYFTVGGDNKDPGLVKIVYKQNGDITYKFVPCESYYTDGKGMAYVDQNLFSSGEKIINEKTKDEYQMVQVKKLKGVYNVNYGYCIFKRIETLYQNEEYCIVKATTENGLSTYDHIIVDATTVSEDDMLNNYKGE